MPAGLAWQAGGNTSGIREEDMECKTIYAVDWFRDLPDRWPLDAAELFDWAGRQEVIPKDRLDELRLERANWTWTDRDEFHEDMRNFYWPCGERITDLAPDREIKQENPASPH
jgi:hypothetical protein